MTNNKLKIGISVGDINGIGLEVILKTLSDKRLLHWCIPVIYGSTKVVSYHKNIIKVKDLSLHSSNDIHSINPNAVNVINCWIENVKITLGKCTDEGGKYASFSLEQSVADLKAGHLDALVTAPINKKAMQLSGFQYPGHTEYLTHKFEALQNLMFMIHEDLRIGLVTNHVPVSQIASTITKELVLQKIELMNQSLKMDFGINKPAIAVLGLNPHAGDEGVLGNEELEIIIPAIEEAKAKGILAIGPYAADGFFGSGNYTNFDGILAMYHDQGLVPFKALAFGGGINFTAGLPVIRTSPDHGTGFDIAGQNAAKPRSFREALYLAIDCAKQRADYLEMTGNPLKLIDINEYEKEEGKSSKSKKTSKKKEPKSETKKEKDAPKNVDKKTTDDNSSDKKEVSKKELTVEERLALAAEKKAKKEAAQKNKTEDSSKENTSSHSDKEAVKSNSEEAVVENNVAEVNVEKTVEDAPKSENKHEEAVVLDDNIIEAMEPIPHLMDNKNNHSEEEKTKTEDVVNDDNTGN